MMICIMKRKIRCKPKNKRKMHCLRSLVLQLYQLLTFRILIKLGITSKSLLRRFKKHPSSSKKREFQTRSLEHSRSSARKSLKLTLKPKRTWRTPRVSTSWDRNLKTKLFLNIRINLIILKMNKAQKSHLSKNNNQFQKKARRRKKFIRDIWSQMILTSEEDIGSKERKRYQMMKVKIKEIRKIWKKKNNKKMKKEENLLSRTSQSIISQQLKRNKRPSLQVLNKPKLKSVKFWKNSPNYHQ